MSEFFDFSMKIHSKGGHNAIFQASDLDEDSDPQYYGCLSDEGRWVIIKKTTAGAVRYCYGADSYTTNWTNRASLTYSYYNEMV